MQRALWLLPFALALTLRPAQADPITITGGSLVVIESSAGKINLRGTQDFRLDGVGSAQAGFGWDCHPCLPGDQWSFGGTLDDFGAALELTFRGVPVSFTANDFTSSVRFFSDPVTIPPYSTSDITLSVPFASRMVFELQLPDEMITFLAVGRGTAQIRLSPHPERVWDFVGSRYDFAPAPVPEPASFFLLGSGLVGLGLRRWRAAHGQH